MSTTTQAASAAVRFVVCERCGAPLAIQPAALSISCRFCGASATVTPRLHPALRGPAVRHASESDRQALLWRQTAAPPQMPPLDQEYAWFIHQGTLAPWRESDALRLWRDLRSKVLSSREAMDEHRLAYVGLLVGNHFGDAGDVVRLRAFLEASLDALTMLPRRQR